MTSPNHELLQRLKNLECRDSTYTKAEPPLVMAKGQGSRIEDAAGRSYIDLCAGFGVMALGHNHPALQEVLKNSSGNMIHGMGDVYPSVDKVEFLSTLLDFLPKGFSRAALALSGGQAVEIALKTAMLATGKSGFICFEGAYHGLDLGLLPVVDRMDFREPFRGWLREDQVARVPFNGAPEVLEDAVERMTKSSYGLAGILVEPLQGRAGVLSPSAGWLATLKKVAKKVGALLIYDEIFVGLGRTGRKTFAEEVMPDLICLGKALGGGLPLSACIGVEEAMAGWPESKGEAIHTGTFFGHPLSCRLGRTLLEELNRQDLIGRSRELGAKARQFLVESLSDSDRVKAIRGEGLMLAIEFHEPLQGARLMDILRAHGVIALASGGKGESITFSPALNIPEEDLWEGLAALKPAIARL